MKSSRKKKETVDIAVYDDTMVSKVFADSKLFLHHKRVKINKRGTAVYNGRRLWCDS